MKVYRYITNRETPWGAIRVGLLCGAIALILGVSSLSQNRWIRFGAGLLAVGASTVSLALSSAHKLSEDRRVMARECELECHELSLFAHARRFELPDRGGVGAIAELPAAGDSGLDFFDWSELADPDYAPHLLFLGGTGSGKTYTADRLIRFLCQETIATAEVLTPKRKSTQWHGMHVSGHPRDFEAISTALDRLYEEFDRRMQDLDREWRQHWIVLDELPSIAANFRPIGNCEKLSDFTSTFIREARESRLRFCFLAQGKQVKLLGIEGQSDLLDNLLIIYLGKFASKRAKELVAKRLTSPELLDWVKAQKYPIIVDDTPALLPPELDFSPPPIAHKITPITSPIDDIRAMLGRCFDTPSPKQSDTAETNVRPPQMPATPGRTSADTSSEWRSQFDHLAVLGEEALRQIVQGLRNQGMSQNKILESVWQVSKNGRPDSPYARAREEFKRLLDE